MKRLFKTRWVLIFFILKTVYQMCIGLPLYLITFPSLTQHCWSPIFFFALYTAYFLGLHKIYQYGLKIRCP